MSIQFLKEENYLPYSKPIKYFIEATSSTLITDNYN